MLFKTAVGYDLGCVRGRLGPSSLPLPATGTVIDGCTKGWKLYRLSDDIMLLADCLAESRPKDSWSRFLMHSHGVLLRRLGKKRVVYLVRSPVRGIRDQARWHSNINLVTGVSEAWLHEEFKPGFTADKCTLAGTH